MRGCLSKLALLLSSPLLPEDAQLRGALCYRLEALCGVLEGVQPSQVEDTFNALHSILSSLSELLRRLAGFGEAILLALDVFRVLAEQFLPHLAEVTSPLTNILIFRGCLVIICLYCVVMFIKQLALMYSDTSLFCTRLGQGQVSSLERYP